MERNLIDVFSCEMQCEYKGRTYRVRDNGAIMRLPKKDGRASMLDLVWTFGVKNEINGYMLFTGNVRVHQVVCTAFHGVAPDKNMIVDHINGNRCDNQPENLRWITREENIFENPLTAKKMEYRFGSIEAARELLHNNPEAFRTMLNEQEGDKGWMRPVSKVEAENHAMRNAAWLGKDKDSAAIPSRKDPGDWLFSEPVFSKEERDEAKEANRGMEAYSYPSWREQVAAVEEETRRRHFEALALKDSLTPGARQLDWKVPTEFPQTPQEVTATPLQDYLSNLSPGAVFSRNRFGEAPVLEAALAEDRSHLTVISKISGATNFGLAEVFLDAGFFVHKSIRTFFTEEGAKKFFTLSLGREWTGGDVFEDYC